MQIHGLLPSLAVWIPSAAIRFQQTPSKVGCGDGRRRQAVGIAWSGLMTAHRSNRVMTAPSGCLTVRIDFWNSEADDCCESIDLQHAQQMRQKCLIAKPAEVALCSGAAHLVINRGRHYRKTALDSGRKERRVEAD